MIDRVWVVDEGEYSDYHVVAIFTDEEQARRFSALRPESNFQAWPVDAWNEDQCVYSFAFDQNGNGRVFEKCAWTEASDKFRSNGVYVGITRSGDILITLYRGPEARALKIASEYYFKIRAYMDEATTRVSQVLGQLTSAETGSRPKLYAELERKRYIVDVAQVLAGIEVMPPLGQDSRYQSVVRRAVTGAKAVA